MDPSYCHALPRPIEVYSDRVVDTHGCTNERLNRRIPVYLEHAYAHAHARALVHTHVVPDAAQCVAAAFRF